MNALFEQMLELFGQARVIWLSGGWAMLAIAVTAVVMFALGVHIYLKLLGKGFRSVSEEKWRRWIDRPEERCGPVGEVLDFVTGGRTLKDTAMYFEELRVTEVAPFERDLRVMKVCVGAAPLLGLLGTVTGMLATFVALAHGSGGDKTMSMVSEGISEALVTTETGLVIALAGLFFQYNLGRMHEQYSAFLTHLETVCTQKQYGKLAAAAPAPAPAAPGWTLRPAFVQSAAEPEFAMSGGGSGGDA